MNDEQPSLAMFAPLYFRMNPPLGFRRGITAPLSPRRPMSQDSLRALPVTEAFGGKVVRLSCKMRTLVFPTLMSFGDFESISKNIRFLLIGTFCADSGGVRSRVVGSVASISAGSNAGSEALFELLCFTGGVRCSSMIAAVSGMSSTISGTSASSTAVV